MNERLRYTAANCTIAATLSVVGDKWTLLVLREAFFGLRRFEELREGVGCARNILSDRLGKLVDHDLLIRIAYRDDGQRERYEYRLTERGAELFPVLVSLMQWGDRWLAGKSGGAVTLGHRDCDAAVGVELRCAEGHGPLGLHDINAMPGRGARLARKTRQVDSSPVRSRRMPVS